MNKRQLKKALQNNPDLSMEEDCGPLPFTEPTLSTQWAEYISQKKDLIGFTWIGELRIFIIIMTTGIDFISLPYENCYLHGYDRLVHISRNVCKNPHIRFFVGNEQVRCLDSFHNPNIGLTHPNPKTPETEKVYGQHLVAMGADVILHEAISINMVGCTYTPDFISIMPNGSIQVHEVKGGHALGSQAASSMRYRMAAALFERDNTTFVWAKVSKKGIKQGKLSKQGKVDPHWMLK